MSHIFWPSSTKWSPSRTAFDLMAATSEPHSGSDMENAPRTSPVAIRGRSRLFCSAEPCCEIRYATMKWVLTMPEIDIQPRDSSSTTRAYVSSDSPSPPYSSAMVRPKSPISRIPSMMSVGYSSACSSRCACGMISLSANSRTVSRIDRCTSVRPGVWASRAMSASGDRRITHG